MANKKFDYSDDMVQGNDSQDENESKEILRHQRLEQRNNALANEFRDLKPEIGRTYNQLCNLAEKSGRLSKTMLNLLELLETALPVRLADEDRKVLQDELNNIAKKAAEDIRKNEKRVSIPQATFWCMVSLLVLLVAFFALVIFANIKLFHSDTLAGMIAIFSILIAVTIVVVVLIFYKYSH